MQTFTSCRHVLNLYKPTQKCANFIDTIYFCDNILLKLNRPIKENHMSKIKEYLKLLNHSLNKMDEIGNLKSKQIEIAKIIFPERIQDTKGFFIPKVYDFITPTNWVYSDPCEVTIYRHAVPDWLDDSIHNLGDSTDVKTFHCPYMHSQWKCLNYECQYHAKLQQYKELEKQIADANDLYNSIVAQRRAAWKNIFRRKSK